MIGCIILGGLAALGIARIVRHRRMWGGGWGCHGHWRGGGGPFGGDRWQAGGFDDLGASPEDGDWGGHHAGGHHVWMRHGPRWPNPLMFRQGRMSILRGVFRRLETTPTQSQAIQEALKEFQEGAKAWKGEARRTRTDLAVAFRRSSIDAEAMGELFARHDSALEGVRKAFVGMMMRVHDVLDDTQRERLAQLIELGPRWFRGAGTAPWAPSAAPWA
jgi:hypothetical protein